MKKLAPITLSILLASTAAVAGGPDHHHQDLNKTFIGVSGGLAGSIAESSATYRSTAANGGTQNFNSTAYDGSFNTGLNIGHQWEIRNNNAASLELGANYNFGVIKNTWHVDDVTTSSDAIDLVNTYKPKIQLNGKIGLHHYFNDSFIVTVDGGPSALYLKSTLGIIDTRAADTGAAPGASQSKLTWGGSLGVGLSFILSQASAIGCKFDYYLYHKTGLRGVDNINTAVTDSLSNRKTTISIPTLSLAYNLYF